MNERHDDTGLRLRGQRYEQRRKAGCSGWSDDESYAAKMREAEALLMRHGSRIGRFLELGCGAGNTCLHVASLGWQACGVEIVPEAVAWAEEKARTAKRDATFRVGSVVALEGIAAASVDVVFDGDCLWMVLGADRATCFANVCRVLRPGGLFRAKAHVLDHAPATRIDLAPGVWRDPATLQSTVNGVPMYQYSLNNAFADDLRAAGLAVVETRIEPPVHDECGRIPGYLGIACVVARKLTV